ncbi:MAG: hypothetical protein QXI39_03580 [Candidatus Bathyarchaeia archaeon]
MRKVIDHLWIWGHEAGSHNSAYGLKGLSRMTPAEGASYLGVPNLLMVRYGGRPAPPFDQYALALSPLRRVVWSIVGAGGRTEPQELEMVLALAGRFPNISGVIMDDFFKERPDDEGRIAVHTVEELEAIRKRLFVDGRRLDLWVTLYTHNLNLPGLKEYLDRCDVITYWTWHASDLSRLEENFERLEDLTPFSRKALGCYMWDYGDGRPMPVAFMRHQCQLGLRWLREDRIEAMIFLASCICDLGIEAVEWTRRWIQKVGEEEV